jgi:hypothetical protein
MSRQRLVPPDAELIDVFDRHPDLTDREIRDVYGWPVTVRAVSSHRRRLSRRVDNPVAGVSSLSRAEFRAAMEESYRVRHWSVTGFDNGV